MKGNPRYWRRKTNLILLLTLTSMLAFPLLLALQGFGILNFSPMTLIAMTADHTAQVLIWACVLCYWKSQERYPKRLIAKRR
jgi:uncharacterized membrane protein YqjE